MARNDEKRSSCITSTTYRVKNGTSAVKFYEDVFGMSLIDSEETCKSKYSYLAFNWGKSPHFNLPRNEREGVLCLLQEDMESFEPHNGNSQPQGYGHICIAVNNITDCCNILEEKRVKFVKKLSDGGMKDIAFVMDLDSYWIELIEHAIDKGNTEKPWDKSLNKLSHSMIRVKDPEKSIKFYQKYLRLEKIAELKMPKNNFDLYFLGFHSEYNDEFKNYETLLELTHNYGTEQKDDFAYHCGNTKPKGFSHFSFCLKEDTCPDDLKLIKINEKGIRRLIDPDGYSLEISLRN